VKQCGKTTLLDVLEKLVVRPLPTANITAAAVFRSVEVAKPTLLIDEADTFLPENEELRGVINSGHRKGGQVIRTVGDNHEPRAFATFSPCVIAMIGKLPDTLADRSVPIQLRRRLREEKIKPFRGDRAQELEILARKAARWTVDHIDMIGECDPELPGWLYNRQADNWRPLFALATIIGEACQERVKNAALALTGTTDDDSIGAQLLADVRDIFAGEGLKEDDQGMRSKTLVAKLLELEDRPWGECNHGKAITQNWLARRLKPFGIFTSDVHEGYGELRRSFGGYSVKAIEEAVKRYISPEPPDSTAPPRQSNENNGLDEF
jgi:putative DNA primase/helicase